MCVVRKNKYVVFIDCFICLTELLKGLINHPDMVQIDRVRVRVNRLEKREGLDRQGSRQTESRQTGVQTDLAGSQASAESENTSKLATLYSVVPFL